LPQKIDSVLRKKNPTLAGKKDKATLSKGGGKPRIQFTGKDVFEEANGIDPRQIE